MLKDIIKNLLLRIVDDIDAGNSNITEEEGAEIIDNISRLSSPWVSKYEACKILHVSRATFDRLVASGRIPKGTKRQGFTELLWRKYDLKPTQKNGEENTENQREK